jgi:two-component system chemotaxis response regulator CheB
MIRVLIAEGSPFRANVLSRALRGAARAVGFAASGEEAVLQAHRLKPDAILMDVDLPALRGPLATRQIMEHAPCAILALADPGSPRESELAFLALDEGAIEILARPPGLLEEGPPGFARALIRRIETAIRIRPRPMPRPQIAEAVAELPVGRRTSLVLIGGGIGGIQVTTALLRRLPKKIPASICLVQTLESGFDGAYARWIASQTGLAAEVCRGPRALEPGRVFVGPDDAHLVLKDARTLTLRRGQPVRGCLPSLTPLFRSAARHGAGSLQVVLLSATGQDGLEGLKQLRKTGAVVLAQTRASCLAPERIEHALAAGLVDHELGTEELARRLALGTEQRESSRSA